MGKHNFNNNLTYYINIPINNDKSIKAFTKC